MSIKKGEKVTIIENGLTGTVTRVCKGDQVWIRVKSNFGNHHHPVTSKTFACAPGEYVVNNEIQEDHD